MLLQEGLIDIKDFQDCMVKGNCKKLGIKLPAWSILQCLLRSAKLDSSGLILCTFSLVLLIMLVCSFELGLYYVVTFYVKFVADQMELTRFNLPRDKVFEWFISPLFTMKDQIKGLELHENEESCLKRLVIAGKNERPEDWDDSEFPSSDKVRRAQLQAVIRRYMQVL